MPHLNILAGPSAGQTLELAAGQQASIGSDPSCELTIAATGLEPQHAVVKPLRGGGFGIKALAAGVRVNGSEVEAAPLSEGDRIQMAGVELTYSAQAANQAAKEPAPSKPPAGKAAGKQPKRLGGFQVLEPLGKGGMGVVYRAVQESLNREVALKVLSHKLTQDPEFVERFVSEARAAARLTHPNVVQVFDVDNDGDTYFYPMELMADGSVEELLKRKGKLDLDQALSISRDTAAALAYAESLGIVHRDVKPDNLMLDRHGAAKLADLGLAHDTGDEGNGKIAGTPHFMAPEQITRGPLDHRTDLYALGCTMYRLLTGRSAFQGASSRDILRAQVKEQPEAPHRVESDIPQDVSAIVLRLMAKNPADRFQSADEVVEALDDILQPKVNKGVWIAAAVAGVLIAGGGLWWGLTQKGEKVETVVERFRDNPEAAEQAEKLRQALAEVAYLRARIENLSDAAKAEALELVASAHGETRFGRTAASEAAGLRRAITQAEAAKRERLQQMQQAVAAIKQAVERPLEAGNPAAAWQALVAASQQLEGTAVEPVLTSELPWAELKDAEEVQSTLAALRARVTERATEALQAMRGTLGEAVTGEDPEAVANAVEPLRMLVEEQWPEPLLAEALQGGEQIVRSELAAARERIAELQAAKVAAQREAGWSQWVTALQGAGGVVAMLDDGRLNDAAARVRGTAGELTPESKEHLSRLAAGMDAAATWRTALATHLQSTGPAMILDDGSAVAAVNATGLAHSGGIEVRDRRDTRTVPWTSRTLGVWRDWLGSDGLPEGTGRTAFLALLAFTDITTQARDYLGAINPEDDASGTKVDLRIDLSALGLIRRDLQAMAGEQLWAAAWDKELAAAELLSQGLLAFRSSRNRSAAAHLKKLLTEHPNAAVVRALP